MKRRYLPMLMVILGVACGFDEIKEGQTYPEVQIAQGTLRGVYKKSRGGKIFASFTKIPYAKPPLGDLRFKAPEAADPWDGIYDGTKEVPKCIQKDYVSFREPPIEGVEDCLFLNVFTPKNALEQTTRSKLLPVMVFIHYGGNFAGSSQVGRSGPEFLLDKPILMVSFNYRLGIFGFFSTLNDDSPGNYGPKDQVLALKWVQANIERFGGDRNQVTIFGQSAGGAATHHLMLSPMARGLFQRVISQSGSALCTFARPLNVLQEQIFPVTGQLLGCDPTNTTGMIACMRALDAETVLTIQDNFKYFFRDPMIVYTHVLEQRSERNPEPFLERDPFEIIQSGQYAKVPWITGTTQDEGVLMVGPRIIDSKVRDQYLARFDELAPKELVLSASLPDEEIPDFWQRLKQFYLKGDHIDLTRPDSLKGYVDMIGDRMFDYAIYQAALLHSMQGQPVWFYNFNFAGSRSFATSVFVEDAEDPIAVKLGVSHCDELIYLFNSPDLFPDYKMTTAELLMSKVMVTLWTNFGIFGNPHKKWQPLPLITSRKATNEDLYYLEIRGPENLMLRNDYRRKSMQFWTDSEIFENTPKIL